MHKYIYQDEFVSYILIIYNLKIILDISIDTKISDSN